jgi:phenylalanyl-tRNA synthetase beta chain
VIADSSNPIALAGVMGGRDTEVDERTTDILVEVATFDPARTRRTRRAAGLSTDASYRFERGVDVALAPVALERVSNLIVSLAGGMVESPPVDLYAGDPVRAPIVLRTSRLARVLGIPLPPSRAATLLEAIGCRADVEEGGAAVHVLPPTWRRDLVAEVDLIEEVARLHGYEQLPDEIRPYRPGTSSDAPMWTLAARLRELLSGAGLLEARPIPFVNGGEDHVRLLNPLAENEAHLRRTVLESLARRAEYNLSHMQGNIRLYEIGSVFAQGADALPDERAHLGILIMGSREPAHFSSPAGVLDAWDAKWLAEEAARIVAGGETVTLDPAAQQGEGAGSADADVLWRVLIGGVRRGDVRRVPLDAPVWAAPAYGVELELGALSNADVAPPGEHAHADATDAEVSVAGVAGSAAVGVTRPKYTPLPTTPASEFDLALLLPAGVRAADVERVIRESAGDLLEHLVAFDQYEGPGIPPDYRSVAWRLTLRHPERTLRDKEIEGRRAKILSALQQELHVRQRST